MATPVYIQQIAQHVAVKLDVTHPDFRGSDEVIEALRNPDFDLYLRTWVLPYIQAIAKGEVPQWMRKVQP